MAGMRQSNKKKVLKKKDGERNLHFPSCTPEVQAALREARRTEWNKWRKFNAGVLLTDEDVRQPTEAGCEIYPMKWVDPNKNAYLRGDDDYFSVPAKYKSRLVGCGNFETTEGLRTDSPAGDGDSLNTVRGVHKPASSFTHAISRTDTFKDKKLIGSCCIVFQLKVSQKNELQEEKCLPHVFPSTVQKNAGRGLWLRLKNTCKQVNFSRNQILRSLRDDESRIIAVMSSNVDDLLCGCLPQGAELMNSVLQQFLVGKEEHGTFRFCGKEFRQDEDLGIHVTAKDNTERVQPITHDAKHGLARKATQGRLKFLFLRSVIFKQKMCVLACHS